MITLVSYPRSGNTFLRNVLFEVYGVSSATYLLGGKGPDHDWQTHSVVKTHELPCDLPSTLQERKIVLLLRDGRDSVVSFAYHRKDIVAPESNFDQNLLEAIYAAEGSHFGGWSYHTEQWLKRADLVIRFEDLIDNPIEQCERLRALLDLPDPKREKLPDFQTLKLGEPQYGSAKGLPIDNLAKHWFRRGMVNGWKDEMNTNQQNLFWHLHGECMEVVGYARDGNKSNPYSLCFSERKPKITSKIRVLIEASKVTDPFTDGIKRYVLELLKAAQRWPIPSLEVMALVDGQVLTVAQALEMDGANRTVGNKKLLHWAKHALRAMLNDKAYHAVARLVSSLQAQLVSRKTSTESKPLQCDVLHMTLPQHYLFVKDIQAKRILATIHDLTHEKFPHFHEQNNIELCRAGMDWLTAQNAEFIAVSNATANDLKEAGKSSLVTHEGVDRRRFYPIVNEHLKSLVRERYALPSGEFLLSVSTLEPRKNLEGLITAYAQLPELTRMQFPLVLAGRKGWKVNANLVPASCRTQVHFVGFVREDHLPALYTLASAFCYVSHYEGFGLPVLEAMACGCPVLAAGNSSMKEIVGEAGLLVDPSDENSIVDALKELTTSAELRYELRRQGMQRSWKFTWSRQWEEMLRIYM